MDFVIPARLSTSCRRHPESLAWLARLPTVIRELEARWSLTVGAPFDSVEVSCAWVAPVTRGGASAAVLKVSMPHFEAEHEIAGLRFWDGGPTVRLIEADERVGAMLLERCVPGTHLRVVRPEVEHGSGVVQPVEVDFGKTEDCRPCVADKRCDYRIKLTTSDVDGDLGR